MKNIFYKNSVKIWIIILILCAFLPNTSQAASLSISPANSTVSVGETLTMRVIANSGNTSLNAIAGSVSFPQSLFSIESVSKSSSILNFWVAEPSFSNQTGTTHFEGVALTGYSGSGGTVISYVLRAKAEGTATVSFKSGQILANDGQGTDITNGLSGAQFTITPAKVPQKKVEEKPIEEKSAIVEKVQEKPSLTAPEIQLVKEKDGLSIVGNSNYPHSQALITFTDQFTSRFYITTKADNSGDFKIKVPHSLKRGSYSVTAVMVKDDGSNSLNSESIIITIGTIFSDLGILFYITLSLLMLMILYVIYHFKRQHDDKLPLVLLKKETKEASSALKKSFDVLRTDVKVIEQKIKLNSKKLLSNDVGIDNLKKDLNSTEEIIDKEIDDINSV